MFYVSIQYPFQTEPDVNEEVEGNFGHFTTPEDVVRRVCGVAWNYSNGCWNFETNNYFLENLKVRGCELTCTVCDTFGPERRRLIGELAIRRNDGTSLISGPW